MLKDREQKILDFIRNQIKMKGYPPTVREICTELEIKSTSTVHNDIAVIILHNSFFFGETVFITAFFY